MATSSDVHMAGRSTGCCGSARTKSCMADAGPAAASAASLTASWPNQGSAAHAASGSRPALVPAAVAAAGRVGLRSPGATTSAAVLGTEIRVSLGSTGAVAKMPRTPSAPTAGRTDANSILRAIANWMKSRRATSMRAFPAACAMAEAPRLEPPPSDDEEPRSR